MGTLKLKISAIVLTTAAIAAGDATIARADNQVVAKVPFAFIVGDRRLPAGDYVVKNMFDDLDVLAIASADGRQIVYTATTPSSDSRAAQPELIFEKFGDQYFLARVVPQYGGEREIVLTPSIVEHELLKSARRSSS